MILHLASQNDGIINLPNTSAIQKTPARVRNCMFLTSEKPHLVMTYSLKDLTAQLQTGSQGARALVEDCLAAIDDPDGEGQRSFIEVYHGRAREEADAVDHARKQGWSLPAFAGIPLSIKDLFDEAGVVTRAGSKILLGAPRQGVTQRFWPG